MPKKILWVVVLTIITFFQVSDLVRAKDPDNDLSVGEKASAVDIQYIAEIESLQVGADKLNEVASVSIEGQLYKIGECLVDSDICYVQRTLLISQEQIEASNRNPANQTYTCGLTVYNGAGTIVGRLQQNVNITGTPNPLGGWTFPLTANWADSRGTGTSYGYTVTEIVGPVVTPGFNQWTNTLNSTIDASFQLATPIPGQSQRATSRLLLDAW